MNYIIEKINLKCLVHLINFRFINFVFEKRLKFQSNSKIKDLMSIIKERKKVNCWEVVIKITLLYLVSFCQKIMSQQKNENNDCSSSMLKIIAQLSRFFAQIWIIFYHLSNVLTASFDRQSILWKINYKIGTLFLIKIKIVMNTKLKICLYISLNTNLIFASFFTQLNSSPFLEMFWNSFSFLDLFYLTCAKNGDSNSTKISKFLTNILIFPWKENFRNKLLKIFLSSI